LQYDHLRYFSVPRAAEGGVSDEGFSIPIQGQENVVVSLCESEGKRKGASAGRLRFPALRDFLPAELRHAFD